jgi:hypothetical protein
MKIVSFREDHSSQWDEFLKACPMATFLHTRLFLSYHKNRFQDHSLILTDDDGDWLAVLPAAINPNDEAEIISHPGITYGGILHKGKLGGMIMVDALQEICHFYKDKGYEKFLYKPIPYIYHQVPSSDDLYALFRQNADLYRRDLSCAIDLDVPSPLSSKALSTMRRRFRKAEEHRVLIYSSSDYLKELWEVLSKNLQEKYATKPVHSYEEMKELLSRFPHNIRIFTALKDERIVAGTVVFMNPSVYHTQYLVVTTEGAEVFALDYLLNRCIELAKEHKVRYFDFGISNENQGQHLNQGLYMSKAKHGGGGIVHDFYRISL